MSLFKFKPNDILRNTIKTHPHHEFVMYNSFIYHNRNPQLRGEFTGSTTAPRGHISLFEMNIDRVSGSAVAGGEPDIIYPFIYKSSDSQKFRKMSTQTYLAAQYGDILTGTYALTSTIAREYFAANHFGSMRTGSKEIMDAEITLDLASIAAFHHPVSSEQDIMIEDRVRYRNLKAIVSGSHMNALKNTINHYRVLSNHYQYSASFRNLDNTEASMISIPSIFYGTSLKKGSLDLRFYVTGALQGVLKDENLNGELIQTGPTGSQNSGSVAGIVLYNEGIIILTGSWELNNIVVDYNHNATGDVSKWVYFGAGTNDGIPTHSTASAITRASSSYTLEFRGTEYVPVLTMFAHARKGELNNSSNPTAIEHTSSYDQYKPLTSSYQYREPAMTLYNSVSSSYSSGPTGSFKKQTFITKIGIYDKDKNLLGIATVANPVKKTEDLEYSFKLKVDL